MTNRKKKSKFWLVIQITTLLVLIYIAFLTPRYSVDDFSKILKNDPDAQEIIKNFSSEKVKFRIEKLDKQKVVEGTSSPYEEVFSDLPQSNELYLIRVLDKETDKGLISVIDMDKKEIVKIYGLLNVDFKI